MRAIKVRKKQIKQGLKGHKSHVFDTDLETNKVISKIFPYSNFGSSDDKNT
jgi:hypothetical protein